MKINLTTMLLLAGVSLIAANPCVLAHTNVTVQQARDLIESTSDLIVVDVREPYEYCNARGHIPGSLNYPWNSGVLQARYEELPADAPILVVCGSGGRSNSAANLLDSNGFSTVYDMLRGMNAWLWETAPCKYNGGAGTPEDPYQIATAADLIALGETPEDYDKHFILTDNIDLDPNLPGRKVFDRAVIAPHLNLSDSWPFEGASFTGVFGGNGHKISRLTIKGDDYIGLFGRLGSGAIISNLGLEAVDVNGTGMFAGGLAGWNECGSIAASHSTGTVTGDDAYVGGLVGWNEYGSIATSHSTSTVTGGVCVGGLVGWNEHGGITASYTSGRVTGQQFVGGLVGSNHYGSVIASYSTSEAAGTLHVGGLVGENHTGSIVSSYSTGTATGYEYVGGLAGSSGGSVTTSYSTGTVSGNVRVGGLVGLYSGTITSSFWDMETSGQTTSDGGTGLTTAEMQDIDTYLSAGWDFGDEILNGTCNYWQISPGHYPRLRYHFGENPVMPEGLGTAQQPYLIRDARDLGTVWFKPMAHYSLDASVDLSGITWSMAVIPWFGETFHGGDHTISHLTISGGSHLGLFRQLSEGANVSNLGLEAVDINAMGDYVGGLVAFNDGGNVAASYSTGTVSGHWHVGGLVGCNWSGTIIAGHSTAKVTGDADVGGLVGWVYEGSITSSYSTGAVSGDYMVGGLAGWNGYGNIATNYSTGAIIGNSDVGGLVGANSEGSIIASYSAGAVTGQEYIGGLVGSNRDGSIILGFWDIETSGQITSAGGMGKTTAEMQTTGTFLDVGWDFVGEMANGTEDIWWILEGQDYPRLWWEADN